MAKESMKAREVKRAKMVARYAEKRAALKKIIATSEDPAEAYEAARKLQSIPRNANPIRLHNRCKITGRPKGYTRQTELADISLWTTCYLATVVQTDRIGVLRDALQFASCLVSF